MGKVSFGPAFRVRGREFRGLRGWSGKPLHPPLTDVPVGAYVLAAAFDVWSFALGDGDLARELYRAATFVLLGGAAVSLVTALTGFWDWLQGTEKGTEIRRTANAHGLTMVVVTALVGADLVLRHHAYSEDPSTGAVVLVLSLVAAALTIVGGVIGGELVYEHGFNVETRGPRGPSPP